MADISYHIDVDVSISSDHQNSRWAFGARSVLKESFKIFVSSPGGLEQERAIVIDEANALSEHERSKGGLGFSIIRWPEDIGAGVADYGQSVINRQTTTYEIFLCIIGVRMGTRTPRANSGTEEEFDRAIETHYRGGLVQVLLFFSDMPVRPLAIDPSQLMLVRAFQEKASRLGVLSHTFKSHDELKHLARVSLQEANDVLTKKSAERKYSVASPEGPRRSTTRNIKLGDITLSTQETAPQWADSYAIPIADYKSKTVSLFGTIRPMTPYFRFGFKYHDSREPLFSAGSIQTVGQNILVHVGRNTNDPSWFVTSYRASYRVGHDRPLDGPFQQDRADFSLTVTSLDEVIFQVGGQEVFKAFFQVDGIPRLVLLAWGDEHSYLCEIKGLILRIHSQARLRS